MNVHICTFCSHEFCMLVAVLEIFIIIKSKLLYFNFSHSIQSICYTLHCSPIYMMCQLIILLRSDIIDKALNLSYHHFKLTIRFSAMSQT